MNRALGTPQRINLGPILSSLEQKRGLSINISCAGVLVTRWGKEVYRDGEFVRAKAVGAEQVARQRLYTVKFLQWARVNAPTSELEAIGGWIDEQFK